MTNLTFDTGYFKVTQEKLTNCETNADDLVDKLLACKYNANQLNIFDTFCNYYDFRTPITADFKLCLLLIDPPFGGRGLELTKGSRMFGRNL